MSHTPFRNAALALAYILGVASILFYVGDVLQVDPHPIIAVACVLSLLVFSVAVMAYIFIGLPLCLYLDGAKKDAVSLFAKTLGFFGSFLLMLFILGISFF